MMGGTARTGTIVALLVALVHPGPIRGQDPASPGRANLCRRARPIEQCRAFLVFSVSGNRPLTQSERLVRHEPTDADSGIPTRSFPTRSFESTLGWEAGAMLNIGDRTAAGAGFVVEVGSDRGESFGGRLYLRRWISGAPWYADAVAGVVTVEREVQGRASGHTGEIRVGRSGLGYLGLRYEGVSLEPATHTFPVERRIDPGGTQRAFFVTAGLSDEPGLLASAGVVVGFLVFAALYSAATGPS